MDNICTDPNLLQLYDALDGANGPRYRYPIDSYALPNLYAGQAFGVARSSEVIVAIADTGTFQDPRSLNEWWQIRPWYSGGSAIAYYTNRRRLEQGTRDRAALFAGQLVAQDPDRFSGGAAPTGRLYSLISIGR
jgi:hypothetical protein